ncbi:MAG: hypothetical protein J6U54_17115 [Clostridiales bacterium]|nr:hypothetical protein [Clostridiales bacterium]
METLKRKMVLSTGQKVMVLYISKEKDRRTIAIVRDTAKLADNHLSELMDVYFPATIYSRRISERIDMKDYYRAVAKCCPEDTWNTEEGIAVAEAKIRAKLEGAIKKRKTYAAQLLHSIADQL